MSYDLVISNGIVCTEAGMFKGGLAIKDGVIRAHITDGELPDANRYYDAKGNIIFPGAVECHSHYGNNVRTVDGYAADLRTETRAAAQGGITTVNCTIVKGPTPLKELIAQSQQNIANIYANFKFTATPASDAQFDELGDLVATGGSNAFKLYLGYRGKIAELYGISASGFDTGKMYKSFLTIAAVGYPAFAMIHAEDPGIFELVTEKVKAQPTNNLMAAFNKARPGICETIDICKAALIAHEVGCPLYIVHVTAKESVDIIKHFLGQGFDMTAETCLHYLLFDCNEDIFVDNEEFCKLIKVFPPIREAADRDRLWKGIQEGIITCVGTDHIPFSREKKLTTDFWDTIGGVGDSHFVLLPLMFSEGVNKGRISLDTLRKVLCENPAKAFGIYPQKGTLNIGADADVVVIDPQKEFVVDYKDSESANEYIIYQDWKVKGMPVATFVNGYLVAENMKIVDETPHGKLVRHNLKGTKLS